MFILSKHLTNVDRGLGRSRNKVGVRELVPGEYDNLSISLENRLRVVNSTVEYLVYTEGVIGSNPVPLST